MDEPERSEESLYFAASRLTDPAQRAAFLDAACQGDAALRRRLDGLLSARAEADAFFDQPPAGAQAALPSAHPNTGRRFGDYELLEEIARGGMGIVFKARQRSLDRIVAVKLVLAGGFASKEQALRFRVEAEAAARLRHPNIVRIHETGEQEGQPYFSMDYVEGGNLAALVREKPLPAKRAAAYVKTIAEAIHHAHEQGILHRDLKPSNVLIDRADQPCVTDFGLAKRMTKESFLTVTGDVMGSPNFMPPEQAGAKGVKAGRYSDVYGLGAILFYLVTGRPPFVAGNVAETLHQVLDTEPVSPRLLNPSVPQDIATICLKCLEKEPAKRFPSAQELADELGRFLNDEPVHARPVGRSERIWRWCRRRRALTVTAMVTAAALVIATALALRLGHLESHRTQERRAMAMDNAFLAARSGDLDEAEKAMATAELAGALPGDLRLLRGRLAFERGDYREATRHLEQAALLSRESVVVPAILSLAYLQLGERSKSEHCFEVVARMNPKTPEDYLFKGLAEGHLDPVRGLELLDKAVQMRPSGFALLLRAEARVNLADDCRHVADAERARAEANLVQEMLPASPLALSVCLRAQLAAAAAYEDSGQSRGCKEALALARAQSVALEHYPQSQDAVRARYFYFRSVGDESAVLDVLSHANGLADAVTLTAGDNVIVTPTANGLKIDATGVPGPPGPAGPPGSSDGWSRVGNIGTTPAANFLGTLDSAPFEVRVNNARALRLEPTANAPNLIGGFSGNFVAPGVVGATIAGGGNSAPYSSNVISASYGTVGGGWLNWVGGVGGVVAGGTLNNADGAFSFAAGQSAKARILARQSTNQLSQQSQLAERYSQLATNLAPTDWESWWARGEVLARADDLPEGIAALRRAGAMSPPDPDFWMAAGHWLERAKELEEACAAYGQALALAGSVTNGPNAARREALLKRHDVLLRLHQPEAAQNDFLQSRNIPSRVADTPPGCLDLSAWYNTALTENWEDRDKSDWSFARLPRGRQVLGGVAFDVRGTIQLSSLEVARVAPHYPARVDGIRVGRECQSLHFLHATVWAARLRAGTRIGSYVIRYADGQETDIPIINGEDLFESQVLNNAVTELKQATVVWTGQAPNGKPLRLFKRTWTNPRPTVAVAAIDFISAMTIAGPFLVAVTAEP